MLTPSLLMLGGLLLLAAGAEGLVRGSSSLELRLGVTPLVVGLTVVAFGNVIGSNILNVLLILGVAALIRPIEVQGMRPLNLCVMVGSAVLVLPLMWRGWVLNRREGALLLAGYVAYLYSVVS